jgi:hypothetical protein
MMKRLYLLFFTLLPVAAFSQASIKDSSIMLTHIRLSYAAQIPGGNLADRFGWNSNISLSVDEKFANKFFVGLEGSFFFGNQVRDTSMLDGFKTSDGQILDQNGNYATVILSQRGFTANLYGGYLWTLFGPNLNSGILLKAGIGYIQHKVKIEHRESTIAGLEGDYLKGYDRYTNGLMVSEFIGYQYLSNNKYINFFAGVELIQGFTKSRRSFDYDKASYDDTNRKDLLYGIRAGWILPLYAKPPKEFYTE